MNSIKRRSHGAFFFFFFKQEGLEKRREIENGICIFRKE